MKTPFIIGCACIYVFCVGCHQPFTYQDELAFRNALYQGDPVAKSSWRADKTSRIMNASGAVGLAVGATFFSMWYYEKQKFGSGSLIWLLSSISFDVPAIASFIAGHCFRDRSIRIRMAWSAAEARKHASLEGITHGEFVSHPLGGLVYIMYRSRPGSPDAKFQIPNHRAAEPQPKCPHHRVTEDTEATQRFF